MSIAAVLSKITEGTVIPGLSAEEVKLLREFKPVDVDGLSASIRLKEEAKAKKIIDDLTAERDQVKAKLAEIEANTGTDAEKQKRALEKAQADLDAATKKLQATENEKAQIVRKHGLAAIRRSIPFMQGVNDQVIDTALDLHFKEVADLNDEKAVKPLIEAFTKANPALINSNSGSGSGGPGGSGTGGGTVSSDPAKQSDADRQKFLKSRE